MFTKLKGVTKWVPKPCPNGTKVTYINKANVVIEKVVERINGTTICAAFHGGNLMGMVEENSRGQIEHYFSAINYNKIIKVNTNRGEFFSRFNNRGNSVLLIQIIIMHVEIFQSRVIFPLN